MVFTLGGVAVVALGGCVGDNVTIGPPRMPQVLAGPPAPPKPVVSGREVLATAIERANREDISGAVGVIETLPVAEREAVVRELIAGIAQQDSARAGRVALAMPAGSLQTEGVEIVTRAMVERDASAGIQWALALSEPATAFTARQTVADQLAERDPRAAVDRLRALPVTDGRNEMLGLAGAAWARRDATTALAWVRELPAGEFKTRMATSIGFAVAQTEPERAVAMAELLPEGRDRRLLFGAIGQTWVARNEGAAWAWARQLPAGASQEAALAGIEAGLGGLSSPRGVPAIGIIRRGRRFAGESAGDAGLPPPGFERDEALRRQFDEALRESPVRAANWLATLPLPDRREEMLEQLARQWLAIDPRAAENWMDQNILLRDRREQLRHEAGR